MNISQFLEVDGDLYLYYTSVKYIETEEDITTIPKIIYLDITSNDYF